MLHFSAGAVECVIQDAPPFKRGHHSWVPVSAASGGNDLGVLDPGGHADCLAGSGGGRQNEGRGGWGVPKTFLVPAGTPVRQGQGIPREIGRSLRRALLHFVTPGPPHPPPPSFHLEGRRCILYLNVPFPPPSPRTLPLMCTSPSQLCRKDGSSLKRWIKLLEEAPSCFLLNGGQTYASLHISTFSAACPALS